MTLEIVDIHPHIIASDAERYPPGPLCGKQSEWSKERPQTFEQLVAEMDAAGVAKAAIVQASTYYGFDNSYVADSVATDPTRFIGVYSVDVFAQDVGGVAGAAFDDGVQQVWNRVVRLQGNRVTINIEHQRSFTVFAELQRVAQVDRFA